MNRKKFFFKWILKYKEKKKTERGGNMKFCWKNQDCSYPFFCCETVDQEFFDVSLGVLLKHGRMRHRPCAINHAMPQYNMLVMPTYKGMSTPPLIPCSASFSAVTASLLNTHSLIAIWSVFITSVSSI